MSERKARWEQPGYSDITAARIIDDRLEVAFANGDYERVLLSSLGSSAVADVPLEIEDGLAVRLGEGDDAFEISWIAIRSATDPTYAQHLAELDAEESRRLGRRLRALREDRELSQAQLAQEMSMPVIQLSRIEKGDRNIDYPTVRSLLQAMRASLADVSGPNSLEISVRALIRRASQAGVPRELGSALAEAVPRSAVPGFLAGAFAWSKEALLAGVPEMPRLSAAVQFKAPSGQQPNASPLVHLAFSTAQLARTAFAVPPYRPIPADPAVIRKQLVDVARKVTLSSLLNWTWNQGIPVLPLAGRGGFAAAVLEVDEAPTIIIKEARDLAVFWLFDLAHELGHLGLEHVRHALIDVQSPTERAVSDRDEQEATTFALELLLPNHEALLDEVRADARGDGVRFKFAVERVAARARVSPGLLGIVAAFALPEVGRALDRWGSATNLAKPEGSGREQAKVAARRRERLEQLSELDAALIRTAVLEELS